MKRSVSLAIVAAGIGSGAAFADNGLAVGGVVRTVGGSIEGQAQITPYIQLRGGYNYFSYTVDQSFDGIQYDGDLDMSTFGAFADVRPFANSFIISGGAYIGDKTLNLLANPTGDVEIGGQTFTPAQVGSLRADAQLEEVAPFVGLGFDTTFQGSSNWGFRGIVGAMFTGTPTIDLTSVGGVLSNDPAFLAEVAEEEANLRDDIQDYEVYPVVQLGVTFRF